MSAARIILIFMFSMCLVSVKPTSLIHMDADGGYGNIVVAFSSGTLYSDFKANQKLFHRLEALLNETSRLLNEATNGWYFKNVYFLLPGNVETNSEVNPATFQSYMEADLRVGHYGSDFFTDQPRGCGEPGETIYIHSDRLKSDVITDEAHRLLQQWAKFQYGVFEEHGQVNNELYPDTYHTSTRAIQKTGCTKKEAWMPPECPEDNANCTFSLNKELIIDTSLMDDTALKTYKFCNSSNHNTESPTPHNAFCEGRSTWDVITNNRLATMYDSRRNQNFRPIEVTYIAGERPQTFIILDEVLCSEALITVTIQKLFTSNLTIKAKLFVANYKEPSKLAEIDNLVNFCPKDFTQTLKNLDGNFVLLVKNINLEQMLSNVKGRGRIYVLNFASEVKYMQESKVKWYNILSSSSGPERDLTSWKRLEEAFNDIFHHEQAAPDRQSILLNHSEICSSGSASGKFQVLLSYSQVCLTVHCSKQCHKDAFVIRIDGLLQNVTMLVPDAVQEICLWETGIHMYTIESYKDALPFFLTIQAYVNGTDQHSRVRVFVDQVSDNTVKGKVVYVVRAIVHDDKENAVKDADVKVFASKVGKLDQVFKLLDNGNGDPDIFKNDGIYSSYVISKFNGVYDLRVEVKIIGSNELIIVNGGSVVFQSTLEELRAEFAPNRIVDLKIIDKSQDSVFFSWTAPGEILDQGTHAASLIEFLCNVPGNSTPECKVNQQNDTTATSPGDQETKWVKLKCPNQIYSCQARAVNSAKKKGKWSNKILFTLKTSDGDNSATTTTTAFTTTEKPTELPMQAIIIGCSVSVSVLLLILIVVLLVIHRDKLCCRRNTSTDVQRHAGTDNKKVKTTNDNSTTATGRNTHRRFQFLYGKTKKTETPASKTEPGPIHLEHRNSDTDLYMDPESLNASANKSATTPFTSLQNRPQLPPPGAAYDEVGENPPGMLPRQMQLPPINPRKR